MSATRVGRPQVVRPRGPVTRLPVGRIEPSPTARFGPDPGRYDLSVTGASADAQLVRVTLALAGLDGIVTTSFVEDDAELREAYDATADGYCGEVAVPVLWDRLEQRIVSDDARSIAVDLASAFTAIADPLVDVYPHGQRAAIDDLLHWISVAVTEQAALADGPGPGAEAAGERLLTAFDVLDARLSSSRYLLGAQPTLADVALFVRLVRFDAELNARRTVAPGLEFFPSLWRHARDLYALEPFRSTTDFAAFTRPGARSTGWEAPTDRPVLAG